MSLTGLLLASSLSWAASANFPTLPSITMGRTFTGETSSISVSVYGDSYEAATVGVAGGLPLKDWSLSVVAIGGTAPQHWAVDLEVSNDDLTWTRILRHSSGDRPAAESGKMVFGPHARAIRARLNLVSVSTGTRICATAFSGP